LISDLEAKESCPGPSNLPERLMEEFFSPHFRKILASPHPQGPEPPASHLTPQVRGHLKVLEQDRRTQEKFM
jgi:hypothetical protein